MQTRRKSIEKFKKCMDEFITGSFTLSNVKLKNLMRTLSSSQLFYTLLDFCTADYDYEEGFKNAFIKGDGFGKGHFTLPSDSKSVIALCFSVLFQLNTNEIDFYNLLDEYFFLRNYNDSFKNFAMHFLVPFRSAMLKAAEAMAGDAEEHTEHLQVDDHSDESVEAVAPVEKKNVVALDDRRKMEELLEQSKSTILQYKIEAQLKSELMILYQAFSAAIENGEEKRLKVAFLGYKYATLYHKKHDAAVWKIEKILQNAGVL